MTVSMKYVSWLKQLGCKLKTDEEDVQALVWNNN